MRYGSTRYGWDLLHVEYLDHVYLLLHLDLLLDVAPQQVIKLPEVDLAAAILIERVEQLLHGAGRHLPRAPMASIPMASMPMASMPMV